MISFVKGAIFGACLLLSISIGLATMSSIHKNRREDNRNLMLTLSSITKVVTSKAFVVGASIATGLFVVGAVIKHRRKPVASVEPKISKTKDEIIQKAARVLETNSKKPKISSEVLKEANFVDVGLNKEAEALEKVKSMSDGEVLEVGEAVKIVADLTSDKDIAEIIKAVRNYKSC